MNCYTTHAGERSVPMSEEKAKELNALLEAGAPSEEWENASNVEREELCIDPTVDSNMRLDWFEGRAHLRLQDEESSSSEGLSKEFLLALGECLRQAEYPYLEVGYAFTADKLWPGTHGGGAFRIYPDGTLVRPKWTWSAPAPKRVPLARVIALMEAAEAIILDGDILVYPTLAAECEEFCICNWTVDDCDYEAAFRREDNEQVPLKDDAFLLVPSVDGVPIPSDVYKVRLLQTTDLSVALAARE